MTDSRTAKSTGLLGGFQSQGGFLALQAESGATDPYLSHWVSAPDDEDKEETR